MHRFYRPLLFLMLLAAPLSLRAEIALRGEARFGLGFEGDGAVTVKNQAQFDIDQSLITDNGLKFGATLRATSRSGLSDCQDRPCGPSGTRIAPGMIYFETGH